MDKNNISLKDSNFINKLESKFNELRKSEQRVVKYILEQPLEILEITLNELAKKTKSSDATVIRACNNLGFDGFQELKFSLKQNIEENLNRIYKEIKPEDDSDTILEKVFRANAKTIDDTLKLIDRDNFKIVLNKLKMANDLALFAQGGATPVATDFYHALINVGKKCIWQPDSNMQLISSAFLGEGDVCLGISRSGEIKDVVEAIKTAKKGGAFCIGLTAEPSSPLAEVVDIALFTKHKNQVFRNIDNSHRISLLTILDALYIGLANADYENTKKALMLSTKATSLKRIGNNN